MKKRPNVLFLLSDEHSFRFLGKEREKTITPNLDRLIDQGTWFTDAYCQMPLCTPSRLSLLTGLEPRRAGAWTNNSILRPELETIPGAFSRSGYRTCLVGKMHLGGNQQWAGFNERPYGDLTGRCGHQWEPITDPEYAASLRARTEYTGVTGIPESLLQDRVVATESINWIRNHTASDPDQPWFLCSSFSRPHFPLTAPERWINKYREAGVQPPFAPASGDAYEHPMSRGMRKGFNADAISKEEMMESRRNYSANVSYLDEVLGDLLSTLERDKALENTIIVYTSDHGEMCGEHGVFWKNGWYESCTRVPLLISTPEQRRPAGKKNSCSTPAALLDLFPTLASLCDVAADVPLQGTDLTPALIGEPLAERMIFTDALYPRWGKGTEFRSVRYKTYKYVRFRSYESLFFDLQTDPQEQENLLLKELSPDQQEALSRMKEFAEASIDFDEAEKERTVRDAALIEMYPPLKHNNYRNLYNLSDGRLINAESHLYTPDSPGHRDEVMKRK